MLRVRWLGRVRYGEALDLQRRLSQVATDDYLLLLEHHSVYTAGTNADLTNLLVDPVEVGADFHQIERGGDLTYHGPGQLTGYPILTLPGRRGGGLAETASYVRKLERLLIDALADVGLPGCGRLERYPGVWVDPAGDHPRKIAAIGVRLRRGRTLHGFALNVNTDLGWYDHIVPCGITEFDVTSLADQGVDASMSEVVDAVAKHGVEAFARSSTAQARAAQPGAATSPGAGASLGAGTSQQEQPAFERMDVSTQHWLGDLSVFSGLPVASGVADGPAGDQVGGVADDLVGTGSSDKGSAGLKSEQRNPEVSSPAQIKPALGSSARVRPALGSSARVRPARSLGRLASAGVTTGLELTQRKPSWLKARMDLNAGYRRLRSVMQRNDLVTVCEEAGCPNIYECWGAGTATFMINGADCTRACGFCLVGTAKPQPLDAEEPARVANAVGEMGLSHVVVTAVARDDLSDGGAAAFAATIRAIRSASAQETTVEVLIPDFAGALTDLQTVIDAAPGVANHNLETVPRLQRAIRPSASYARSLTVLARLAASGLITKSGLIVGMGETDDEVDATLADLAAVGTNIVTIGQYLRPTQRHVPVARWVEPAVFEHWRDLGHKLGIDHVESSPLTRSSYHAERGAVAVAISTPDLETVGL